MTRPDGKEIWNAWLVAIESDSQAAAIRTLIKDYGYSPRGAAAILRWAFGSYLGLLGPLNWKGRIS